MKQYTDIEQSRTLTAILPLESADMYYPNRTDIKYQGALPIEYKHGNPLLSQEIAAWSLAALLDVLKQVKEIKYQRVTILVGRFAGNHWYVELLRVQDERSVCIEHSKELVDACYEMIIRLHKQKLL